MAENVALGMENPPGQRDLAPRIREVSEAYGLPLDPDRAGRRSVGRRTPAGRDHPLPAAGPQAADHGRADLRADPARGGDPVRDPAQAAPPRAPRSSISATSSKRSARCATHATILRLGKVVATCDPREKTGARAGRDDGRQRRCTRRERAGGDAAARCCSTCAGCQLPAPAQFGTPLQDISLDAARGRGAGHRRRRGQRAGRVAGGAVGRAPGRRRHACSCDGRRHRAGCGPNARRARWGLLAPPRNGWAMPPPPT